MMDALELATRFYTAVAKGDLEAAAAFVDHERLLVMEASDLPFGGTYEGIEGFRALFARMRELWKRAAVDGLSLLAEGNTAIARLHLDVISRMSGVRERLSLVEVCECDGGKIVRIQPFYFDAARVWAVAGIERPSR